ncbi:MAG: hypothetical protein QME79_12250 [Bacillota bacterium]|nr:hypothetical protein [Bacillota bacterium]
MVSKRLNITIPVEVYELARQAADKHYGGNLSRYLADAGLYYAGVLAGRQESVDVSVLKEALGLSRATVRAWKAGARLARTLLEEQEQRDQQEKDKP